MSTEVARISNIFFFISSNDSKQQQNNNKLDTKHKKWLSVTIIYFNAALK